jgi:large subunit ribosomal protein L17
MHRHGYRGRKFGRERDQRNALMRGLMLSLVQHQSIVTTVQKAKELRPMMEKLITKAKKGDLANRRNVIAALGNVQMGNCLVDTIAPQVKRDSGYLRIEKLNNRVGDNAEMARIEFVDEMKFDEAKPEKAAKTPVKKTEKSADKKGEK